MEEFERSGGISGINWNSIRGNSAIGLHKRAGRVTGSRLGFTVEMLSVMI